MESSLLPPGYGDNFITLLALCPHRAYAFWEVSQEYRDMATRHFHGAWSRLPLYLRLYDITGIEFDGTNANSIREIALPPSTESYYFSQVGAGRSYCVDLAIKWGGEYISILRSGFIQTPPGRPGPLEAGFPLGARRDKEEVVFWQHIPSSQAPLGRSGPVSDEDVIK